MATGREIAKELLKRKDVLAEVFTKVLVDSGVLKEKEVVVEVTKELTSEKEQELNAKIETLKEDNKSKDLEIAKGKDSYDQLDRRTAVVVNGEEETSET